MKKNNNFTDFEMLNLKAGVLEEIQNNVRIHSAMENETFELLMTYFHQTANPENYEDYEVEITKTALHKICDFWIDYFDLGERVARERYSKENEDVIQ